MKRLVAFLLSVLMLAGIMPVSVFANEGESSIIVFTCEDEVALVHLTVKALVKGKPAKEPVAPETDDDGEVLYGIYCLAAGEYAYSVMGLAGYEEILMEQFSVEEGENQTIEIILTEKKAEEPSEATEPEPTTVPDAAQLVEEETEAISGKEPEAEEEPVETAPAGETEEEGTLPEQSNEEPAAEEEPEESEPELPELAEEGTVELALTEPVSGTCDDNLTWTLTTDGVLTISGNGSMIDFLSSISSNGSSKSSPPWYSYRSSILSVRIESGVTSIGGWAFKYCSSLTSISIPSSVWSIGYGAFEGCESLTSINIPESVRSIGGYAFNECSSLTSINIPDGVTSIGSSAFSDCSSLTSINIPSGVTFIGAYAFNGCSSLTSINIPSGVTSIKHNTFAYCSSLTSINIPSAVTSIGGWAFKGCESLTSINIPDNVMSIGEYAFYGCSGLTSINIPDGVTSIEHYTFVYCSSLTSINIPSGVTSIGGDAFYGCSSLTSINIPSGVTSIGSNAFEYCSSLTTIEIPSSVTRIYKWAFYGCDQLTDVYYAGTQEQWNAITISTDNEPLKGARIHYSGMSTALADCHGTPVSGTGIPFTYVSADKNEVAKESMTFRDEWFLASPTVYNHELAITSLQATMAATTLGSSAAGTIQGDGSAIVREFLKQIGCSDAAIRTTGFDNNHSGNDKVARAFGVKSIGEGYFLVPVLIRSSGYGPDFGGEWASNFRITQDGYAGYAAGFKKAAEGVYDELMEYLDRLYGAGIPEGRIRVWVCGFSRGGAVANILAEKLNRESGIGRDNIFAYTFATPTVALESKLTGNTNIFNIVNEMDVVPRVPLREWTFGRYGTTRYIVCNTSNREAFTGLLPVMEKNFSSIMAVSNRTGQPYRYETGQEVSIDLLLDILEDMVEGPSKYRSSGLQAALVTLCGRNGKVTVKDIFTEIFGTGVVNYFTQYSHVSKEEAAKLNNKLVLQGLDGVSRGSAYRSLQLLKAVLVNSVTDSNAASNMVKLVGSMMKDGAFNSSLLMQHWPEAYLAWLRAGTANSLFDAKGHKIASIKCPVDVTVYDENGTVVCRIVNDVVDDSVPDALFAYVENGEKYIYISDEQEYRTVITAREEGEVSVVATGYDVEHNRGETVVYANVPMEETQRFDLAQDGSLATEGQAIRADYTYSGISRVTATLHVAGSGAAVGDGDYSLGDSVTLHAISNGAGRFVGWFDGTGTLVSTENEYRVLLLEDMELTAVFSDGIKVRTDREYLLLEEGGQAVVKAEAEPQFLAGLIRWEARDGENRPVSGIITVDGAGTVRALNKGTAYAVAYVTLEGLEFSARCRVDAVEGEDGEPAEEVIRDNLLGVVLPVTAVATELYSTSYATVDTVLVLPQNQTQAEGDNGHAMTGARFVEAPAAEMFRLRVKDDRTLEIIPTEKALEETAAVLARYQSAIAVTVGGEECITQEKLTLTVKKGMPALKAARVSLNSALREDGVTVTITGGTVTDMRVTSIPAGFSFDVENRTVTYTGTATKAAGSMVLDCAVDGWAVRRQVTVPLAVAYTAPKLTVKPAKLTVKAGTLDTAKAAITVPAAFKGKPVTVSHVTEGTEEVTDALTCEVGDGMLMVTAPVAPADGLAHVYKVWLALAGKEFAVTVTVPAATAAAVMTLKAKGAIDLAVPASPATYTVGYKNFNAGSGEAYTVTLLRKDKVTGEETDETEYVSIEQDGNTFTVKELLRGCLTAGGIYTLVLEADLDGDGTVDVTGRTKVTVKRSAKVAVSAVLKAKGSIDPIRDGTSVTLTPTIRNWYLHAPDASDITIYRNALPMTEDVPFTVSVEGGAYVIRPVEGAVFHTGEKYTAMMQFATETGTVASKPVAIPVKQGKVAAKAAPAGLTLYLKDRHSMDAFALELNDGTLKGISRVELDAASAQLFRIVEQGYGTYAIGFVDSNVPAVLTKAVTKTVKLNVYLEGSMNTKSDAVITLKVAVK